MFPFKMGGIGLDISWIESIVFGIISGLTEILPVSSQAHQSILLNLFGVSQPNGLLGLFALTGSFLAVLASTASAFKKMRREFALSKSRRRRQKKAVNYQTVFDWNFLKTATVPVILSLLLHGKISSWRELMPVVSVLLAINGLVLYVPSYLSRGNKDSRSMSGLDGLLFGLGSSLGLLPGFSRVGSGFSTALARGADGQQAFRWCLLLSVPALAGLICVEAFAVFSGELSGLETQFLLKCVVTAITSCIGTNIGIRIMKAVAGRSGLEGFSYYSWGAALFSFILYLY